MATREHRSPQRAKSFFPKAVIEEIDGHLVEVDVEASPRLLQDLRGALDRLVERRRARVERGEPALTTDHRRRLRKIDRAVDALIVACGPNVEATQGLIGQWAEAGLLHGLTLGELVDALCTLSSDLSFLLSEGTQRKHRPPDLAFQDFCLNVVLALASAGEPVRISRAGSVDAVIRTLLVAGAQHVPVDLLRHITRAVARYPAEAKRRRQQAAAWGKFDAS